METDKTFAAVRVGEVAPIRRVGSLWRWPLSPEGLFDVPLSPVLLPLNEGIFETHGGDF